jgi:uncharacterized cofD-like protein
MTDRKYDLRNIFRKIFHKLSRWFTPGIGIKRWLLVVLAGCTLVALGISVLVIDFYRETTVNWLRDIFLVISLSWLPRWTRSLIFGSVGLAILLFGIWELNRSILKPFMKPGQPVLDTLATFRKKEKGPRIVAIGGGTGLSTLLRGLKKYTNNLTAIVTVTDDGGSSGELRKNLGILPPGDIRNCLTALADDEEMLSQIFQYRFGERANVNGHSLGNLFISALTDITGSFEDAVSESGRVLAVKGKVMPSTLHDVRLVAEIKLPNQNTEVKIIGETSISSLEGDIQHLWIEPSNTLPFPPAVQSILNADLIILGPGSLYTSVLPNLLVVGLADAIEKSKAVKFFVCNVANQRGETQGFQCIDHISVIEKHLNNLHFDVILCNNRINGDIPVGLEMVVPDPNLEEQYSVYFAPLNDTKNPWRHDSDKLAEVITDLYFERTGPILNGRNIEPSKGNV